MSLLDRFKYVPKPKKVMTSPTFDGSSSTPPQDSDVTCIPETPTSSSTTLSSSSSDSQVSPTSPVFPQSLRKSSSSKADSSENSPTFYPDVVPRTSSAGSIRRPILGANSTPSQKGRMSQSSQSPRPKQTLQRYYSQPANQSTMKVPSDSGQSQALNQSLRLGHSQPPNPSQRLDQSTRAVQSPMRVPKHSVQSSGQTSKSIIVNQRLNQTQRSNLTPRTIQSPMRVPRYSDQSLRLNQTQGSKQTPRAVQSNTRVTSHSSQSSRLPQTQLTNQTPRAVQSPMRVPIHCDQSLRLNKTPRLNQTPRATQSPMRVPIHSNQLSARNQLQRSNSTPKTNQMLQPRRTPRAIQSPMRVSNISNQSPLRVERRPNQSPRPTQLPMRVPCPAKQSPMRVQGRSNQTPMRVPGRPKLQPMWVPVHTKQSPLKVQSRMQGQSQPYQSPLKTAVQTNQSQVKVQCGLDQPSSNRQTSYQSPVHKNQSQMNVPSCSNQSQWRVPVLPSPLPRKTQGYPSQSPMRVQGGLNQSPRKVQGNYNQSPSKSPHQGLHNQSSVRLQSPLGAPASSMQSPRKVVNHLHQSPARVPSHFYQSPVRASYQASQSPRNTQCHSNHSPNRIPPYHPGQNKVQYPVDGSQGSVQDSDETYVSGMSENPYDNNMNVHENNKTQHDDSQGETVLVDEEDDIEVIPDSDEDEVSIVDEDSCGVSTKVVQLSPITIKNICFGQAVANPPASSSSSPVIRKDVRRALSPWYEGGARHVERDARNNFQQVVEEPRRVPGNEQWADEVSWHGDQNGEIEYQQDDELVDEPYEEAACQDIQNAGQDIQEVQEVEEETYDNVAFQDEQNGQGNFRQEEEFAGETCSVPTNEQWYDNDDVDYQGEQNCGSDFQQSEEFVEDPTTVPGNEQWDDETSWQVDQNVQKDFQQGQEFVEPYKNGANHLQEVQEFVDDPATLPENEQWDGGSSWQNDQNDPGDFQEDENFEGETYANDEDQEFVEDNGALPGTDQWEDGVTWQGEQNGSNNIQEFVEPRTFLRNDRRRMVVDDNSGDAGEVINLDEDEDQEDMSNAANQCNGPISITAQKPVVMPVPQEKRSVIPQDDGVSCQDEQDGGAGDLGQVQRRTEERFRSPGKKRRRIEVDPSSDVEEVDMEREGDKKKQLAEMFPCHSEKDIANAFNQSDGSLSIAASLLVDVPTTDDEFPDPFSPSKQKKGEETTAVDVVSDVDSDGKDEGQTKTYPSRRRKRVLSSVEDQDSDDDDDDDDMPEPFPSSKKIPSRKENNKTTKTSTKGASALLSKFAYNGGWVSKKDCKGPQESTPSKTRTPKKSPKKKPRRRQMISSDEEEDEDCSFVVQDESLSEGERDRTQSEEEEEAEGATSDENDEDYCGERFSESFQTEVLEFFNTAHREELEALAGCSRTKAQKIMEIRPFDDFNDVVEKMDNTKSLTSNLIENCEDIFGERRLLSEVLNDCSTISDRIQQALAREDELLQSDRQMAFLDASLSLKPYQLVGVNWMKLLHKHKINGILADEMGLGKTVQVIAFLASLLEEGNEGPHLIIAPASTLENWLREFNKWAPTMEAILYQGDRDYRMQLADEIRYGALKCNVLITSYNTAMSEQDYKGLFRKLKLQYSVYDEGHMLKNIKSLRFKSLMKIKSQQKLLLTGTPLQNNLLELMSLISFVVPKLDSPEKMKTLQRIFSKVTGGDESTYVQDRIKQAKQIMQPFVLRRVKDQVLEQLPQKIVQVEICPMAPEQKEHYNDLKASFQKNHQLKDLVGNRPGDKTTTGAIMELRKLANHPLLMRRIYTDDKLKEMSNLMLREPTHRDADPVLIHEDMSVMSDFELHLLCKQYHSVSQYRLDDSKIRESGKFHALDRILPELKEQGLKVLIFSQFVMMLDILEPYMKLCKHRYLRMDGSTSVSERGEIMDKFVNDPDIFVFLLSTKACGLGINLTIANTVILHDIDYNPHNDKQAEDRCHRLGQTRNVTVIKLVSQGTIDESMLQRANQKLHLERQMISGQSEDGGEEKTNIDTLLKEALEIS